MSKIKVDYEQYYSVDYEQNKIKWDDQKYTTQIIFSHHPEYIAQQIWV